MTLECVRSESDKAKQDGGDLCHFVMLLRCNAGSNYCGDGTFSTLIRRTGA